MLDFLCSVADPEPDPEKAETFGWIRIRSGTEINVLIRIPFHSGSETGFESGSKINL